MMRCLSVCVLLAPLAACAGPTGPTVRGEASVSLADGTTTGFSFDFDTRLERALGECVLSEDGARVVLIAPDSPGLRRLEIHTDRSAGVVAIVGEEVYSAACAAEETYRHDPEGLVGLELACELTGPEDSIATAHADLHLAGCQ